MSEIVERCVLCGSAQLVRWRWIDQWFIEKCGRCGLAVLNPHPTDAEMHEEYNKYWGYPPTPTEPEEKARQVAKQDGRVRQVNELKSPGRWLDVGAGTGTLLVRARQDGWDIYGCEIARHLVEYAAQEYDLTLYQGMLQEYRPPCQFDVISMYHILEHVASPINLLRGAHERLKGNGLLVVEVPNVTSLDARLAGKKWEGWALPVHFYHFTPDTLTEMLEYSRFRVICLDYDQSCHHWARLIDRLVPPLHHTHVLSGTNLRAFARKA